MNISGVNFYYVLWKWPNNPEEVYPVKLCVQHKGKRKYYGKQYNIDLRLSQEDFDVITNGHPRSREKQAIKNALALRKQAAESVLSEMDPFFFDFVEFERLLFRKGEERTISVVDALKAYMSQVKSESTKDLYLLTSRVVESFAKDVTFSGVDIDFLKTLEAGMKRKKMSVSTVALHMRNIRTVYNKAIRDKIVRDERYPFGRGKYILPEPTESKKLTEIEVIRGLYQFSSDDKDMQFARDMYIFSLFCGGANAKDIFLLTSENIKHESIEFKRKKTGGKIKISIPVIDTLSDIIERQSTGSTGYLFDVMSPGMTPTQFRDKLKKTRKKINRRLRKITGDQITMHEARHSFSTYAASTGMIESMISYFMGHSSRSVTRGYMSFPVADKFRSLRKLEDYINKDQNPDK